MYRSKITNAGSWDLAVQLCRRFPRLRLYLTHPGGGQYDCLTLLDDSIDIQINRVGSVHILRRVDGRGADPIPHDEWTSALAEPGGPRRLAERVAAAAGLRWPASIPTTQPHTLTYRVIARLLAGRTFDPATWDAGTLFVDTSGGMGGGIVGTVPTAEMAAIPANRLWTVTRDSEIVAWLWDGWCWTRRGDRIDLMGAYAHGATLDELVAVATSVPGSRRAAPLPPLSILPEQPVGEWP